MVADNPDLREAQRAIAKAEARKVQMLSTVLVCNDDVARDRFEVGIKNWSKTARVLPRP